MRKRYVQALDLSPGFSDFGDGHDGIACTGVGVNRVIERVLWGGLIPSDIVKLSKRYL